MGQDATKAKSRTPKDLYAECKTKESRLKKLNIKNINQETLKFYLFELHQLFPQLNPRVGAALTRLVGPMLERRKPFDFSIIQQEESGSSEEAWRYRQLLEHLKETNTIESRWLLIARWLKQEGVCEPEGIMPPAMLRRALRSYQRKERISNKDCYKWCLVSIWIPYFERLIRDRRSAPKSNLEPHERLRNQGYEPGAITASMDRESPIAAVTSWFEASDEKLNGRSFETAYSRVEVNRRRGRAELAETSQKAEHHKNRLRNSVK